jgi:hypothetical protein
MTESEALLAIQELLDGVEWTPSTLDKIAQVMIQAGYRIRDLDDVDIEDDEEED